MSMSIFPKRSVQLTAIAVIISTVALAATNPSRKQDYVDYASQKLIQEFNQDLEEVKKDCDESEIRINIGLTDLPIISLCNSAFDLFNWGGEKVIKAFVNTFTYQPQNFLIFSIYTTEIKIPTQETKVYKTIGIGGQFFTFYGRS